jgi:hypothetical protein
MHVLPNQGAVFYPEELSILGNVLDEVVQSLPPDLQTLSNRMTIARNLLACFLGGERDSEALGQVALMKSMAAAAHLTVRRASAQGPESHREGSCVR